MVEENKQAVEQATAAAVESIGIFTQTNKLLNEIAIDAARASNTSTKVADLFAAFLDIDSAPLLEPVKEPVAEPIQKISITSIKDNAFDIAKLALIIPFLIDKTSREYIASFIKGLVGAETLDKITTTLKIVAGVLVGVFAVKLFKQVSDTITTFVKLSQLVGTLFGLTQQNNDMDVEDARKTEREKWENKKKKYEKNTSEHRKRRLDKLEKAKKLRKVLKALGTAGKFTGIGFIVGAASNAFVDGIFDYFVNDEQKAVDPVFPSTEDEKDQEFPSVEEAPDSFGVNILKKFISNLTLGVISEERLDRIFKTIGSVGKLLGNKVKTSTGTTNETTPSGTAPLTKPTVTDSQPTVQPITSNQPVEQASSARSNADNTDPRIVSTPISTPATSGAVLNESSAIVIGAKKDSTSSSIVINTIDNSVLIATQNSQPKDYGSHSYSVSVGA
jgi:hypothetical protein